MSVKKAEPRPLTDAERLDWLQKMSQTRGGLLLHNGTQSCNGATVGLGIWPNDKRPRTLRDAVDSAARDDYDF